MGGFAYFEIEVPSYPTIFTSSGIFILWFCSATSAAWALKSFVANMPSKDILSSIILFIVCNESSKIPSLTSNLKIS